MACDLVEMVRGREEKHLAVPRLNTIEFLQQLTHDLIGQGIVASGTRRRNDVQFIEKQDHWRVGACPLE
ncbi:MAG TPA: hypothetical protein VK638_31005, partial [Edaphobacter sp.]|nr:hypothetical protein [Edaphobacter sp.]